MLRLQYNSSCVVKHASMAVLAHGGKLIHVVLVLWVLYTHTQPQGVLESGSLPYSSPARSVEELSSIVKEGICQELMLLGGWVHLHTSQHTPDLVPWPCSR